MNKKVAQQKVVEQLTINEADYRFIPFGTVFVYFFLLLHFEFYLGSYSIITNYFNILPKPYFIDLKILLCGIDSVRAGTDPYKTICVEGVSLFNYPYLWTYLSFIPFLTNGNHIYIGVAIAIMFFSSLYFFVGKVNLRVAIVYLFLFISPALVLGVERGNCDLIIFMLFLFSIFFHKHSKFLGVVVIITSVLKLFPIGGLAGLLKGVHSKQKNTLSLIAGVVGLFVIYLIVMKDNILLVSEKTPRPFLNISYGLGQIPSMAVHFLKINPDLSLRIYALFVAVCLIIFVLIYRIIIKRFSIPVIDSGRNGVAYLIGSGIFITTCLIGYNYEYRLMFLIFTIPQLISWYAESRKITLSMLVFTILLFWQSFLSEVVSKIGQSIAFNLLPDTLFVILGYLVFKIVLIILLFFHLLIMVDFLTNYVSKMLKPSL